MANGNWSDLRTRVLSAVVMLAVGGTVVWVGGWPLVILGALIAGLMVWELTRMIGPDAPQRAQVLGLLAGGLFVVLTSVSLGSLWWFVAIVLPLCVAGLSPRLRQAGFSYSLAVTVALIQILALRMDYGLAHLLWLASVVIASDVMGYFAGRSIGGPKFWPAISPKKTWSGTAAGWIGAAVVGYFFGPSLGVDPVLLAVVSMVMALAAQMGDIAESAIKRKSGIKDSSNLIPGHGGLMDRFDGFTGAGVFLFVLMRLFGVSL